MLYHFNGGDCTVKEYKVDVYFGEKPKANTGGTMKAYKIDLSGYTGLEREVISKAVQEKAFELGYRWHGISGKEFCYTNQKYLFFNGYDNSICVCHDDDEYYPTDKNTAITVPDFLALKSAKDDEKPAHTLKPFDRVLVRDDEGEAWENDFYGFIDYDGEYTSHHCVGAVWNQCIPYEGNEELIGTNKEPKE